MGALVPYGYLKNPENVHQLIPDEEAAEVVRMIFTMAAEGKKKPEIARFLNEQGTPTCMEHFQAIGLKRKSHREKEKKAVDHYYHWRYAKKRGLSRKDHLE